MKYFYIYLKQKSLKDSFLYLFIICFLFLFIYLFIFIYVINYFYIHLLFVLLFYIQYIFFCILKNNFSFTQPVFAFNLSYQSFLYQNHQKKFLGHH